MRIEFIEMSQLKGLSVNKKELKINMKNSFKKISLTSLLLISFIGGYAQATEEPVLHTAVPSLGIAPDARGGGMGDLGAATLPDVFSQYWNPSKYAFAYSKAGAAISYTPWLRKLVNDIALMQAVGYYKLGEEDNQAISASIRYFSVGEVALSTMENELGAVVKPHEYAFDLGYSRKLSETFSGGVAIRYIRTDYTTGMQNDDSSPGSAFAADISGYNESYVMLGQVESLLGIGFNLSNIGSKISTNNGETNQFLPANLRIGASLTYPLDDYNSIAFNADLSKVLVPTVKRMDGEKAIDAQARYSDMSFMTGIFKSFDNPTDGSLSIGAEYAYNNQFFVRGGYFYETERMGNRKYLTAGAGFKMSSFQIDAAYLLSSEQNSPLDQTIRFSLSFDMDGLRNLGR